MTTKMVIDCDPGLDDAVALILAHRHAEVIGITTVSGNAPLHATTANALLVTALLEADTPVHAGAAPPLGRRAGPRFPRCTERRAWAAPGPSTTTGSRQVTTPSPSSSTPPARMCGSSPSAR